MAVDVPGVLTHVPDVAVLVLRVEVAGDLVPLAVDQDLVVDDGRANTFDRLRPVRDPLYVDLPRMAFDAAVEPAATRRERPRRIVDPPHEIAGADGLWPLRPCARLDRRARAGRAIAAGRRTRRYPGQAHQSQCGRDNRPSLPSHSHVHVRAPLSLDARGYPRTFDHESEKTMKVRGLRAGRAPRGKAYLLRSN